MIVTFVEGPKTGQEADVDMVRLAGHLVVEDGSPYNPMTGEGNQSVIPRKGRYLLDAGVPLDAARGRAYWQGWNG